MNENIVKLLQKVAEDEALQEKMKSFTDPEEAYEFARTIQDGFTK
ncbi:MAG: Nif11-like leader peptide family natural product precursor [Lachnospiraceae bacterium]|nr:Nif11-like leader peptide family natural product precursor [Lachnospiraceae bacterium]